MVGELLADAAEQLTLLITDELHFMPARVVIDVAAVTVIDAPGANALVLAAALADASEVWLCLRGVRGGPVETLLTNLNLFDQFTFDDPPLEA